ncbi:hypothetical protein H632_c4600p0, partial [Helicosporidium sp. ATCC 50920]
AGAGQGSAGGAGGAHGEALGVLLLELRAAHVVLRLRFYNHDARALLTLKGKQVLRDGIGRSSEQEVALEPAQARRYLEEPGALLEADIPLVQDLREALSLQGLVSLGGFCNVRQEFDWEGLRLELDQTQYEWGTLFELECETDEPEAARDRLEAFLSTNDVAFSYSATSKFANFIKRTLL